MFRRYKPSSYTAVIAEIMNKSKELIKSPKYYITGINMDCHKIHKKTIKTTAFQTAA